MPIFNALMSPVMIADSYVNVAAQVSPPQNGDGGVVMRGLAVVVLARLLSLVSTVVACLHRLSPMSENLLCRYCPERMRGFGGLFVCVPTMFGVALHSNYHKKKEV